MAVKYGFSYEIKDGKVVINGFYKASGGVDIILRLFKAIRFLKLAREHSLGGQD